RDEVRLLRFRIEAIAPHPALALELVQPVAELPDLADVSLAADRAECDQLPAHVDDVAGRSGGRELLDAVALLGPAGVADRGGEQVERPPALRGDLERADAGRAAIGLLTRQLGASVVVDLEVIAITSRDAGATRLPADVFLEEVQDQRNSTRHGARRI